MNYEIHLPRLSYDRLLRRVSDHISLMRPTHWSKSVIAVPIGPLLMLHQSSVQGFISLIATIAMFALASSAVYVINDLADIERDSLHPTKRLRPLPSGAVSPQTAKLMLIALFAGIVVLSFQLPVIIVALVAIYLGGNLAYSLYLKHIPIVEMLIVAQGFALRTASGYLAFGLALDERVIATVFAGSLLLTIGKRREELSGFQQSKAHRPVLAHYSEKLLDAYLLVAAISCFGAGVAAMLHIFDDRDLPVLFFISMPFVIYLFQHYLMLAYTQSSTSNPTKMLLTDRTIHVVVLIWALALGIGIFLDVAGINVSGSIPVESVGQ